MNDSPDKLSRRQFIRTASGVAAALSAGAWGKASLAACPPIGYGIGTVSGALVDQHIGEIWCLVLATLFCLGSAACIRELELAGVDVH